MKKTLCVILAVLLIAVSLCACGAGANKIVGSWSGTSEGITVTMTFEEDGSGVMAALGGLVAEDFTYSIDGSKITLKMGDEESEPADYSIDGDTLTITVDGETLTLTKDK